MALATKFRVQGTSDVFGQITVNIKLNDYVGSIIDLDAVGRNWINLKIGDNSSEMSSPILAGKLTFSFYVNTDFQTTEIGKADPFTYYVEALDSSNVLIWAGWAMPEEYSEAYQNTPYVATVSASDGLDELKNVNYPLLDGKATLFTHIQNALVGTFVTNKFFESVNIYSNGMNSTAADSPLRQAQVTYNSFRTISESPKAYEVLSSLLVPFFCRIYQYRGWRIENILEKRSSYIVREYSSSGVYIGQSTFNPLVRFDTDYSTFKAFIQKSGQLSIRPALNNAEVYFNTVEPVEPTTTGGFQTDDDWVSTTELDQWTEVGSNISIEKVTASFDGNEFAVKIPGRRTSLELTNYIESDPVNIATADYNSINVDFAHYANYPSVVLFGTKPILYFEIIFTETSSGDVYNWSGAEWVLIPLGQTRRRLRIDFNERFKWRRYSAVIDRVPSTGNIKFRFYKLIKSGTEGVTELRLTAWKTNLITVQPTNASLLLEAGSTNVFTQYKGPSFPHIISDGTVLNAAGVMDVSNVLTATWARRGVTESLNIRRLFLTQWLSFNSRPTEILSGTIHQKGEVITPMSVVKDNDSISSVRYVMQYYELSLGTGIGSASYREIVLEDANINAFQEFVNSIRLGDFFATTVNYNIFIGGAPGLSPGANPGLIDLNMSLNGDVRGGFNQAEITPASIQNKSRLDTTGLTANDIVFGAVKDTPDQENMTNLRLGDTYPILDTNFVPYTGAKFNVNLGEKGITSGYVQYDLTPTATPTDQGTTYWDDARQTVALIMNGTIQHIGQDTFYYVKNSSGSSIPKGTCVRFAGTEGASGHLLIAPFLANGSVSSNLFMGVTAETIANGSFGQVMHFGELEGINTNAYTAGALLYASTTVAGGFQTTVPVAPNNIVLVGAAINSKNNGTISVRPTYGSNINQDEGVRITSPTTGDLLQLQTGGLWQNKSLATIGLITGSLTSGYIPRATGANTLTNSAIFETGTNVLIGSTTSSGEKLQVTGTSIFKTSLVSISGSNPVLRIGTSDNISTVNFRNVFGEDAGTVQMSTPATELAITTNVSNYNIRIQPHGTGKIVLPNVPTGTGDVLMINASNHVVKGSAITQTTGTFTPTLTDAGGGATYTITVTNANYVKIGNIVYFSVTLSSISSTGTGISSLLLGGLPFTSATGIGKFWYVGITTLAGSSYSKDALLDLRGIIPPNDTEVEFNGVWSSWSAPTFTSGTISISGFYST